MGWVEQTERAHSMQPLGGHMLQEAAEKLVRRQGHTFLLMVVAVAVTEGHALIVAGDNRLVAERSAMHVAAEVLQDVLWPLDRGLGEDDPALVPGDLGKLDLWQRATRQTQEAPTKVLGQRTHRYQKRFAAPLGSKPCAPIGCQSASGHEHVDVRMPLECARPSVQHRERTDAAAEPARVGTQYGERLERRLKEHAQEHALVGPHDLSQLGREREHDVEVLDRQYELSLLLEPSSRGVVATLWARPMPARVIEQMCASALCALGQMAAQCQGAALRDRLDGTGVTGQHGIAVALQIVGPMPTQNVGEAQHGSAALEVGHQAVDDLLKLLAAWLRHVHVELGRAHGLVAEYLLDRAQRYAALE